jgi:hypothetical protein
MNLTIDWPYFLPLCKISVEDNDGRSIDKKNHPATYSVEHTYATEVQFANEDTLRRRSETLNTHIKLRYRISAT